jgi:hypothetical protein
MPLLLAKLVPFRDWVYLGLFVALVGLGLYERAHLIHEGEAHELASLQRSSAKLQAAADANVTKLTAEHAAEVAAIRSQLDEQQQTNDALAAADAQRLREYDAYRRAHEAVGGAAPGPVPGDSGTESAPGGDDRYGSLGAVAVELAAAARDAQSALSACVADRDSLTGK